MSITVEVMILFTVVLAGMLCRKLNYLTDETILGVTQIVVNVTLPCLTVSNMQRPFSTDVLVNFLLTLALSIAAILLCLILGLWLFRNRPHARRTVLAGLGAFSNCGFMGYPIILAVNPDWMIYAVAYNIAFSFTSLDDRREPVSGAREHGSAPRAAQPQHRIRRHRLCPLLRAHHPAARPGARAGAHRRADHAAVHAAHRPAPLRRTPSDFKDRDFHLSALLRLAVFPLMVYGLLRLLPISSAVAGTIYPLTAMPAGTMVAMQAELYGGDSVFAARAVAYSTLLCMVSVPIMSLIL